MKAKKWNVNGIYITLPKESYNKSTKVVQEETAGENKIKWTYGFSFSCHAIKFSFKKFATQEACDIYAKRMRYVPMAIKA
jgi:hypothetical protein